MHKFFGFTTLLVIFIVGFSFNSCKKENEEDLFPVDLSNCDTTSAISYNTDLLPLFQSQCYSCHSAQAQLGGFNMEDFTRLQASATSGVLYEVLTLPRSNPRAMPPGGISFPDCDILKIKAWADRGGPNN
jgi:mono/diheme cytochrome c family protein